MSELEIIQGCQAYHKDAFKQLVTQYSPYLMAVCKRYMSNTELAEDMLQETFIKIFQSIVNYQSFGSFKGWMSRIAANTCMKELKKNEPLICIVEDPNIINLSYTDSNEAIDENGIYEAIQKLNTLYRMVFNLFVVEGYDHKEIANMLDITESNSRILLMRAKLILKTNITNMNNQIRI